MIECIADRSRSVGVLLTTTPGLPVLVQDARALPSLTDAVFYFVISGRRSAGRGSDVMTHGSAAAVGVRVGLISGGSLPLIDFGAPACACVSRLSSTFEKLCETFSRIHESTVTSKIIDTGQSHVISDDDEGEGCACVCVGGVISGDLSVDTTTRRVTNKA